MKPITIGTGAGVFIRNEVPHKKRYAGPRKPRGTQAGRIGIREEEPTYAGYDADTHRPAVQPASNDDYYDHYPNVGKRVSRRQPDLGWI